AARDAQRGLTRTTVRHLRAIRAQRSRCVAQPLRNGPVSRGPAERRDHISHTRTSRVARRAGGERVMTLMKCVRSFAKDDSGQDLLEYALLVALIALVAFGAVKLAGNSVNTIFSNIASQLGTAT